MMYRRFGRTELPMPVITAGGMRYQKSWTELEWSEIDDEAQANLRACIDHAWANGITHIETARGYGTSERQLGRVLPDLDRERLILQTKVGPTETAEDFIRTFETSLERLGADHVDLLGIHGVNNRELLELTLKPGGCLEAAEALRRDGRCRFLGFSTHAPTDVIVDGCH